jgi:hypothetical protein
MPAKVDVSDWLTEAEAAAELDCSVRTIQRYASDGKIEMRKRQREGRKPESVCNPSDVDKLRPSTVHVMPKEKKAPPKVQANGQLNTELRLRRAVETVAIVGKLAAAMHAQTEAQTERWRAEREDARERWEAEQARLTTTPPDPWISIEEAAALVKLTPSYLRVQVRMGKIPAVYGGPHGALRVHRGALLEWRG